MIYAATVAACWVVFIAYWAVSSTRVKPDTTPRTPVWMMVGWRVLAVLVFILLLRVPGVRELLSRSRGLFSYSKPAVGLAGDILCVTGVAIAIWSRACLGANWSARPAVKVGHELVTSGPYRLVRHPIYTGMLLGALGTALDAGIIGLSIFVVACVFLISRIPVEERLMTQLFAEQYVQYKGRTKALIPYVV